MNPSIPRSLLRPHSGSVLLSLKPIQSSRCATYVPLHTSTPKPQHPSKPRDVQPRPKQQTDDRARARSKIVPDAIVPQLSPEEITAIYSQELFVFRCDVIATQIPAAMISYKQLRDLGVLTENDISNLSRQIHARYRIDMNKKAMLPHIKMLVEDLKQHKIPGHPLASVHLLSCLKDMEEFVLSNDLWKWLMNQNENFCDSRTYGAAIECLAYQGASSNEVEELWQEALERYSTTTIPSVAKDTGRGVPVMLLQGIITARLFHNNWRAAYDSFDICVRLYPTLTPARIYELFIYERPVKEAYIAFLMACRAGTPPKPGVLTPLLKEVWVKTRDIRAMIRLVYTYVGAGGEPVVLHMNALISGVLGSLPTNLSPNDPEYESTFKGGMHLVRKLVTAFKRMDVPLSTGSFNTIISLGGRLRRQDLVRAGLKEMVAAKLHPTMVTYRTILNAVGELRDKGMVEETWTMLKTGREELREAWDVKDFQALVKACAATDKIAYFRSELEACKPDVDYAVYQGALAIMKNATERPPIPNAPRRQKAVASPISKTAIWKDIKTLSEIFSSSRISDFSTTSSHALFSILPGSTPERVTLSETHEAELREIYQLLSPSAPNAIDIENSGTKTSTGYDIETLRWENWKAVNRLLFEAECWEVEQEMQKSKASELASGSQGVFEPEDKKVRGIGYEFLFMNENKAKVRIRAEAEKVKSKREIGERGWRRDEMKVRGRLVFAGETEENEDAEKQE